MKRRNWSYDEQLILAGAYLRILRLESSGQKVNKSAIRREVLPRLDNRSAGSYEMKMMNISAAMVALDLPFVQGYKPYGHAQKELMETMRRLVGRKAA